MKIQIIFCVVAMCFTLNVAAQSETAVADKQYENGDYILALQHYLKGTNSGTVSYQTSLQIARCYHGMGLHQKANNWFNKAVSLNDADFAVLKEYGKNQMMNAQYLAARSSFEKYSEINPAEGNYMMEMCDFALKMSQDDETLNAVALPINTISNETTPCLINNKLYFNTDIQNIALDVDAKKILAGADGMILIDETRKPLFMGIDSKMNIGPCSSNGDLLLYTVYNNKNNSQHNRQLSNAAYIAQYTNRNLESITPLPINSINYSICDATWSSDGTAIFFSSDMTGGYGGYDLYSMSWDGKQWGEPVNLGPDVNTIGNEKSPFLTNNGKLYFSSDYHKGLGGYDIFQAQLVSGTWINAQNMGMGINSCADDYSPVVLNGEMYFVSTRINGLGGEDLYKVILPSRDITFAVSNDVTMKVNQTNEEHIPKAVFVGDYQPKGWTQHISKNQQNATIRPLTESTVEKEIAAIADEVEVTPPPAFKIPDLRGGQTTEGTLASYADAKLVATGMPFAKPAYPVYFIQLASLSQSGKIDQFKPLTALGNVYKVYVANVTKIRLGYFQDHANATKILERVRTMGFKDAFLINDDLDIAKIEMIYPGKDVEDKSLNTPKSPQAATKPTDSKEIGNFTHTRPLEPKAGIQYKVRLASYEDPIWFDGSKVKDLGRLEQWSKGTWTIFIMSGYDSYVDADKARIQAINRGYADAEVVIDNEGIIERIKKN